MASVYDLKPRFQNVLRPVCGWLARRGVTANQVTVSAAVMSLAEGAAIFFTQGARWALALLPVVLFLRMALNAIDGMLAREFNQKTKLGAVLNELGDVVSDTALYLPFTAIPGIDPLWVAVAVSIAIIAEMTGVVAVQIGASRRYDGPMGKSDRALWIGFWSIVLIVQPVMAAATGHFFMLLAALGLWTIFNRTRAALKEAAAKDGVS